MNFVQEENITKIGLISKGEKNDNSKINSSVHSHNRNVRDCYKDLGECFPKKNILAQP